MRNQASQIKRNGRVYSPDYIVKNILDLSDYCGEKILKKHVIDNSCGDGAFLCEIVKRYCEVALKNKIENEVLKSDLHTYIHGIELEKAEYEKCIYKLDALVLGYGISDIQWDITRENALSVNKFDGKMDFVLGNPPYVRIHNFGESFDEIKSFSFTQKGMSDLYLAFYEIGIKMLNPEGTLGYITPSSFFNSIAGAPLRKKLIGDNLLSDVVDLGHFQPFRSSTYTAISILKKNKTKNTVSYFEYSAKTLAPCFIDELSTDDYYIAGKFYFAKKENLSLLKNVFHNVGHCNILVKNGYATLCDDVFVRDFSFESDHIIPAVKASTGSIKKILYPYDRNAKLISLSELKRDTAAYSYLTEHKKELTDRDAEQSDSNKWYAFGRSQALKDTYENKLSINALLRTKDDWKIIPAPKGVGVFGGLYIVGNDADFPLIIEALTSDDFISFIKLLGKYKRGGYYTFSSKDVQCFLDYKLTPKQGVANE